MKRKREQMRAEKRRQKAARRAERSTHGPEPRDVSPDGSDPDIAHIKPGPQPKIWEHEDFADGVVLEEEEEDKEDD